MPKSDVVLSEDLVPLPESLILKKNNGKIILIAAAPFFEGLNLRRNKNPLQQLKSSFKDFILNFLNVKPNKR